MRFDRFTERAQDAAARAYEILQRYSHNQVDTEHILLALLEQPEGLVPAILMAILPRAAQAGRPMAFMDVMEMRAVGSAQSALKELAKLLRIFGVRLPGNRFPQSSPGLAGRIVSLPPSFITIAIQSPAGHCKPSTHQAKAAQSLLTAPAIASANRPC